MEEEEGISSVEEKSILGVREEEDEEVLDDLLIIV
jgi:hypothetical protein